MSDDTERYALRQRIMRAGIAKDFRLFAGRIESDQDILNAPTRTKIARPIDNLRAVRDYCTRMIEWMEEEEPKA